MFEPLMRTVSMKSSCSVASVRVMSAVETIAPRIVTGRPPL